MSNTADEKYYPIMESFKTLQGEGVYSGCSAYFIRLGGCDVGCVWCDVKESWDIHAHPLRSISYLDDVIRSTSSSVIVITGGEPLLHDLSSLTQTIQQHSKRAHIETSGSSPLTGNWDWICVSPKKFKEPLPEVLQKANELKIIIYNSSDFEWAEKQAKWVSSDCVLLLQPEWERKDRMMPEILDYIANHPNWRLSVQMHKYIHIP